MTRRALALVAGTVGLFAAASWPALGNIVVAGPAPARIDGGPGDDVRIAGGGAASRSARNVALANDHAGMAMTFHDEFDALVLRDRGGRWSTHYDWGGKAGRWIPGEQQVYVEPGYTGRGRTPLGLDPFRVKGGILSITASPTPAALLPLLAGQPYVSGMLTTKDRFAQQYGYVELRARLPRGQGYFPAFWLMPADGSWPPEIDVMEALGRDPGTIYMTAHTKEGGRHLSTQMRARVDPAAMHRYGLDWTRENLVWYVDGIEAARMPTPASMHRPFYLLIDLAMGGAWGGPVDATTGTGSLDIDYVRVYAHRDTVAGGERGRGSRGYASTRSR